MNVLLTLLTAVVLTAEAKVKKEVVLTEDHHLKGGTNAYLSVLGVELDKAEGICYVTVEIRNDRQPIIDTGQIPLIAYWWEGGDPVWLTYGKVIQEAARECWPPPEILSGGP